MLSLFCHTDHRPLGGQTVAGNLLLNFDLLRTESTHQAHGIPHKSTRQIRQETMPMEYREPLKTADTTLPEHLSMLHGHVGALRGTYLQDHQSPPTGNIILQSRQGRPRKHMDSHI